MSDITIPGVTSGLNTENIVSKLMELERIPLQRKEDELKTYETDKRIWQDLSSSLTRLQDNARSLYGSDNPFSERSAESSDERVLTASADRGAFIQEKSIRVISTAKADRFLSDSVDEDFEAPSGNYGFTVGDEKISFNFRGGTLKRLAERINSRGNDLVRAQVIKDTPDTSVIMIESTRTGEENRLVFDEGTALEFAVASGILKRSDSALINIPAVPLPGAVNLESVSDREIILEPGAEGTIPVNPSVNDTGNLFLEFKVKITNLEQGEWSPPPPPPGPDSPESSGISFKGISIDNSSTSIGLPEWQPPSPPERIVDFEVFSSVSGEKKVVLPALRDTQAEQTVKIKLSDLGGSISGLAFNNRNTFKNIIISDIRIYDPDARGDWEPSRPVQQASDARLSIDGIEITRKENSIDDLVPGVTLNLRGESEKDVTLNIRPDREMIKDRIISFIGTYNRLQAELSILTSTDGSVVSEIDYFTDDEKEKAFERLGHFQGDSTLVQMKSRLQLLMMEPYPSADNETRNLLSNIGISTNSTGFGGGINNAKLRGYMEIDEDKLDSALESDLESVKDIFGIDTNGDLVIDNGAAFKTQEYAKPFTGSGGIVSYRITSLDSRINRTERDIANYELKLEDKEAELKNKYAIMEGNINSMQQSSNALNNLNFGNNNNR